MDLEEGIIPANYPGLASLLWNRDTTVPMAGADALCVYERGWRHLDWASLSDKERGLIQELADRFGAGHLLVAGVQPWAASDHLVEMHLAAGNLLLSLDHEFLHRCQCRVVGEHRADGAVEFLCSDRDGYRELRTRLATDGFEALLIGSGIFQARETRFDQFGIMGVLDVEGIPIMIKLTIAFRNARIAEL